MHTSLTFEPINLHKRMKTIINMLTNTSQQSLQNEMQISFFFSIPFYQRQIHAFNWVLSNPCY